IGLLLLATVTSLPELVTGIGAVALADVPDIALGNIFGACVINLAMIVVLDLLYREQSIYTKAGQGHILAAAFGLFILGFVALNLVFAGYGATLSLGHVGLYSPVVLLLYVAAVNVVIRYERRQRAEYVQERAERYPGVTLRAALVRYASAAAVVVAAALYLPFAAGDLAARMQWNQSFVGTLFVSLATTLPELTVTVGALRIGAVDLAVGNLLGSNLFNLAILAVDDLFYLPGPLLSAVSPIHLVSALSALMMSALAIAGLLYKPRDRILGTVGWISLLMIWIYGTNALFLFYFGG
ncbi:MAG: sodium:calcium antiporter, partial [Burkholderiales bacterium]